MTTEQDEDGQRVAAHAEHGRHQVQRHGDVLGQLPVPPLLLLLQPSVRVVGRTAFCDVVVTQEPSRRIFHTGRPS